MYLHEPDYLCTPPDSDAEEQFSGGCRVAKATALFPSFNVFFDGGGGCFLWVCKSLPMLTHLKAWHQPNQGGCIKVHPVQTFHFQHHARTLHFVCCKVGILLFRLFFFYIWTPFSHKEIMDMEIEFFYETSTEKDPKLLMKHIQRMASGEAPFFATTLSSVYDKLVEKAFAQPIPSGSGFVKPINVVAPSFPLQASTSTSSIPSTFTSGVTPPSNLRFPTLDPELRPQPVPSGTDVPWALLQCKTCGEIAMLRDIYVDACCPRCPSRTVMHCQLCGAVKLRHKDECARTRCRARFL